MTEVVKKEKKPKKPKGPKKPKVIGLKALFSKTYALLEGMPEQWVRSFGALVMNFIMIVWGQSGAGKSNFIYQMIAMLVRYGNVLYISLEEGTEMSAQLTALRHLNSEEHAGKVLFADHEMTFEETLKYLSRKRSPQFVVIDSVQYWDINYTRYKRLKEAFPKKGFIFISHASGKNPDGKAVVKIRYDAGIKVWVEGGVAFPICRYGGNRPYIIAEEKAVIHFGKKKVNLFKK